jgi:thiol:disulfide interchange protein DsbD
MKIALVPAIVALVVLSTGLALAAAVVAKPWWIRGSALSSQDFLDPDVAFRVRATIEGQNVHVHWTIADGYYLYRDKMQLRAESPDLAIDAASWPAGTLLKDPNFGPERVYFDAIDASAAFHRSDFGAHPMQIKVVYQGCAKAGLCYPPITRVLYPTSGPVAGFATPPQSPAPLPSHRWEFFAILGGSGAFLLAGLVLRKNRHLPTPA